MKALRTIRKIENNNISISLPNSFLNKQVEIIVFPITGLQKSKRNRKESFKITKAKIEISKDYGEQPEEF